MRGNWRAGRVLSGVTGPLPKAGEILVPAGLTVFDLGFPVSPLLAVNHTGPVEDVGRFGLTYNFDGVTQGASWVAGEVTEGAHAAFGVGFGYEVSFQAGR